jgi:ankyrin repeat protein
LSHEHTTLAYLAAEHGHTQALDALHSLGAQLQIPALDGATPIIIAAENGHHESVEVPLHLTSTSSLFKVFIFSVIFETMFCCSFVGLFLIKSISTNSSLLQLLARHGVRLNDAMIGGATATYIAACNGHHEVWKLSYPHTHHFRTIIFIVNINLFTIFISFNIKLNIHM